MDRQCTLFPEAGLQGHRTVDTFNSEKKVYQRYPFRSSLPADEQKLTSAALRSPVIAPIDKRVGGSAYSVNDRLGELPQPTPLGYEQRPINRGIGGYSDFAAQHQQRYRASQGLYHKTEVRSYDLFKFHERYDNPSQIQSRRSLFNTPQSSPPVPAAPMKQTPSSTVQIGRSCANISYVQQANAGGVANPVVGPHHRSWSNIIGSTSTSVSSSSSPAAVRGLLSTSSSSSSTSSSNNSSGNIRAVQQQQQQPSGAKQVVQPSASTHSLPRVTEEEAKQEQQQPRPRANNATKLLSESLSYTMALTNNPPAQTKKYFLATISNIPWTTSISDLENIFKDPKLGVKLPSRHDTAQCIHIMIDKTSGKTMSEAYVEFETEQDMLKVLHKIKNPTVKGRRVYIHRCTTEKLFREVFPRWRGIFVNGRPCIDPNDEHAVTTPSSALDNSSTATTATVVPPPLVESHEYESLLGICRNFKLHFSRKCPERPFENFISMMVKFPWDKPEIITTMQRDHLYEYYKLATGVLRGHLGKVNVQIDRTLMPRMVRAAMMCPGFTIPQKKGILAASEITCPSDLFHYIETPEEDESSVDE